MLKSDNMCPNKFLCSKLTTHLFEQVVMLGSFVKPREVDLEEEQVLPCCGVSSTTLSQGHCLTDPLTGKQVAHPQLKENWQLRADVPVHCGRVRQEKRQTFSVFSYC